MTKVGNGALYWTGVALLLAVLVVIVQLRYGEPRAGRVSEVMTVAPCDLDTESCDATLDGRLRLTLSVTPRPIRVITPLTIVVDREGEAITAAEIRFTGIGMDMGINRFPLRIAGDRIVGEAMLPVCVQSRMPWRATLELETVSGPVHAEFEFTSSKP